MKRFSVLVPLAAVCMFGLARFSGEPTAQAEEKASTRVFELRTYHAAEGKLDGLLARFRDHTNALFKKHDIEMVGYWTPADGAAAKKTLIYILAYPSREAHDKSWKAFNSDPEWIAAREESEKNGKLVDKVDSVMMNPTDFSPMK